MLLSVLQAIETPVAIPEGARSREGARVGLLYRAGEWERAHGVAQGMASAEGSFWHGILHRQERDWGNAAYWFRRVGQHAVYAAIRDDAVRILREQPVAGWRVGGEWDAVRFVDWCEQAAGEPGSAAERASVEIQAAEFRHLFDWCVGCVQH
jgi:hypothetical protein